MQDLKFSTASKEIYGEVGNCVVCDREVHPGTDDACAVLFHRKLLCTECGAAMLEGRRVMREMIRHDKMENFN